MKDLKNTGGIPELQESDLDSVTGGHKPREIKERPCNGNCGNKTSDISGYCSECRKKIEGGRPVVL